MKKIYEAIARENICESNHVALMLTDEHGKILLFNQKAHDLLGYSDDEITGEHVSKLHTSEDSYEEFKSEVRSDMNKNGFCKIEYLLRDKNNQPVWLFLSGQVIHGGKYRLWSAVDITPQKRAEEEIATLKERLEYALEGNKDVVWDWDIVNDKLCHSDKWKEIVGYTKEEIPYEINIWLGLIHPKDRRKTLVSIKRCLDGADKYLDVVYRIRHKNGEWIWILLRAVTIYNKENKAVRMVGTHRDISHTKKLEIMLQENTETIEKQRDLLWHQAHHDDMTGLPNRKYFYQLLKDEIALSVNRNRSFGLFYLDIDNFKSINDTYGHDVGDKALRHVAKMLKKGLRADDVVARLSGDEFVAIIKSIENRDMMEYLIQKIQSHIGILFAANGNEISLSVSIGAARYPDNGEDETALLQRSDKMMYLAKSAGRGSYAIDDLND